MQFDYDLNGPRTFVLHDQPAVIGRAATADLVLDHWSVSRRHATIEKEGEEWWITDASSANGVTVNGTRVRTSRLRGGDTLQIGAIVMRVNDGRTRADDFLSSLPTQTVVQPVADLAARRDDAVALLVDAARLLMACREIDPITAAVANLVITDLRAERVLIVISDVQPPIVRPFGAGSGLPLSRTLMRVVEERRISIAVPNVRDETALAAAESMSDAGMRALMCAPLYNEDRVIGAMLAEGPDDGRFTPRKLELLTALANLVAVAIERSRERDLRQRLAHDLDVGRQIQRSFLPATLPQHPALLLDALFLPARQVSGDFYDAFALPGGSIAVAVADVCDKGVGAALFMALFRTLLRSNAMTACCDPVAVIRSVSDYIATTHGEANMFATIFFAIIEPLSGAIVYVNAGHEPPVIFGRGGRRELPPTAPACGFMPDIEFAARSERLESGDRLVVWTDGAMDARNAANEPFGRDRVMATVEAGTLQALEQALRAHGGAADPFDDITVLTVLRP